MITIYRLSRIEYYATAFCGLGARIAGGRWNSKGVSVVYASCNRSLATFETLVHLKPGFVRGLEYVLFEAEIPEEVQIEYVDSKALPENWRESPPPKALASIGDTWFREERTAVLKAPSAVISLDYNYLLNPFHKDFRKIKVSPYVSFEFDERLMDIVEAFHNRVPGSVPPSLEQS